MRLAVRVSPGAAVTKVGGRYGDTNPPVLVVWVTARAIDGKANKATVRALANALDVPRRSVRIVGGERARTKIIEVEEVDPEVIAALLHP